MAADDPPAGPRPERTEVVPPQRLVAGKYRLGRQIGEGGMGAVYEAVHLGLGAKVAVKILSEQLAENPTFVKRFRREARASAAVQHENVVSVTDTGEDEGGVPYLVMELLEGETLAATLRRERVLIPQAAAEVTAQMLRGLGAAHDKGVIHRDLKPGNIFLAQQTDGTYRVKVLDFGISKFAADVSNLNVTIEGTIVGTPNFMAPEQVLGKQDVDSRADLYAVGVMLYRMLTGKLPYAGSSSKEVYDKIIQGNPLRPHQIRPDIPAALENVVLKAMARKAAERFQTAAEFLDALKDAVPSLETNASKPGLSSLPRPMDDDALFRDSVAEKSRVSAPTRSDRPHVNDSIRRVTTPLARAYEPGTHGQADLLDDSAPRTTGGRRTGRRLLVVGTLAAAAIGAAVFGWQALGAEDTGESPAGGGEELRYVVRRFASEKEVRATHEPLTAYLSDALGVPVRLHIAEDFEDLGHELRAPVPTLAAIPAYSYVRLMGGSDAPVLLARAVMNHDTVYKGAIVTREDSGINHIADLRGRTVCFVGESSASGWLYPRALFRKNGLNPDADITSSFRGDHERSIRALHDGACDAAAVYEGMVQEATSFGLPQHFRILASTEPIPYDGYCMSRGAPRALVDRVRAALLALDPKDPRTKKIFGTRSQLQGFATATDSDYDGVRYIIQYLDLPEGAKRRN